MMNFGAAPLGVLELIIMLQSAIMTPPYIP